MVLYSFALLLALALSAPIWGWRMLRQRRYREGLTERLGRVPQRLVQAVGGRPVVWLHAVSVGETFAATRLVHELEAALPGYAMVVSTTTPAGQHVARERFGAGRVFFYPLDFAFAVRRYLRAVKPSLVVLMESELWPRMIRECARAGIPVAVVNARVSDRSYPRYRRLRFLWRPFLKKVTLLLAQSEQDSARWKAIGVPAERVRVSGNLKYDIVNAANAPLTQLIRRNLLSGAQVLVAGSTHDGEEVLVLAAFATAVRSTVDPVILVLAPRQTQRTARVAELVKSFGVQVILLSVWRLNPQPLPNHGVLLVDTIGDLASLYSLAAGAFVGGSLVRRGGHNPLEAAQFGVPVAIGIHHENFRQMLQQMGEHRAVTVVQGGQLAMWFAGCLAPPSPGNEVAASGGRALAFFQAQRGATARTVEALLPLVQVRQA